MDQRNLELGQMKGLRRRINTPRGMLVAFGVLISLAFLLYQALWGFSGLGIIGIFLSASIMVIPPLTLSEAGFNKYMKVLSWIGRWG